MLFEVRNARNKYTNFAVSQYILIQGNSDPYTIIKPIQQSKKKEMIRTMLGYKTYFF